MSHPRRTRPSASSTSRSERTILKEPSWFRSKTKFSMNWTNRESKSTNMIWFSIRMIWFCQLKRACWQKTILVYLWKSNAQHIPTTSARKTRVARATRAHDNTIVSHLKPWNRLIRRMRSNAKATQALMKSHTPISWWRDGKSIWKKHLIRRIWVTPERWMAITDNLNTHKIIILCWDNKKNLTELATISIRINSWVETGLSRSARPL